MFYNETTVKQLNHDYTIKTMTLSMVYVDVGRETAVLAEKRRLTRTFGGFRKSHPRKNREINIL